jgi:thioredoxin reductase (NADPH)
VVGIEVTEGCEVVSVERRDGGLVVKTRDDEIRARTVLLAAGRRGAPRRLGVPGEHRTKVAYELIEPDQYRGRRCVVVGGGDSAVETAMMLADAGAETVDLVHRGARFDRIKPDNRHRLDAAAGAGRLRVTTSGGLTAIEADAVDVHSDHAEQRIANDFVFVCIGGELPTALLARAGIEIATFTGEPPGRR